MAKTERRPLALDASVVVALVAGWHEKHEVTRSALEAMGRKGHDLFVPTPALIESYSVLTRLPPPHRLSPKVALQLLRANFERTRTPALLRTQVWKTLDEAVERAVAGGRVHDWIIARTASHDGPCILVTSNARHFEPFETDDLWVRTPEMLDAS